MGDIDVRDEVGVTSHNLSGSTEFFVLVTFSSLSEVPDHEGSISGSGEKEFSVLVLLSGDLLFSDLHAGNPSVVTLEETFIFESVVWLFSVCHFALEFN